MTIAICILTLVAVAFGRVPGVSLSRAALALAGAVLLVVTGSLDLSRALQLIDGEVLVLLFGLMVVNVALAEAGAFRLLTAWVTSGALGPRRLLALLVLSAGVLSALFLNDTIALMLTPLVVRSTRRLGLPPLPYLLALALAVNAGSVATVTGNPQNVLVAVAADVSYGAFAARLAPVALMSLVVVFCVVVVVYRRELSAARASPARSGAAAPPVVGSGATAGDASTAAKNSEAITALPVVRPVALAMAGGAALAMLVAFVAGVPVALASVVAAAFLLVAKGRGSGTMLRRVDYSLLVLFSGLFVVVGALADTGLPQRWLIDLLPTGGSALEVIGVTTAVTAALSNLVSNVPAVLILLPATGFGDASAMAPGAWFGSELLALTLAMASTLAGNLTLVASIANLIVAEGARRLGVDVGFWAYLRVGLPVTLTTLLLGSLWLYVSRRV